MNLNSGKFFYFTYPKPPFRCKKKKEKLKILTQILRLNFDSLSLPTFPRETNGKRTGIQKQNSKQKERAYDHG